MTRILMVVTLALMIQSCREGCKDKTALNYDSRAKVDNGNCEYCKSFNTGKSYTYFFPCPNAPNPNVNSVEFILVVPDSTVMGNGCQNIGRKSSSLCNNYLMIINLTNQTINGNISVNFDQNGRGIWGYAYYFQGIGRFDTVNLGIVDTTCSDLTSGTLGPYLGDLQFI